MPNDTPNQPGEREESLLTDFFDWLVDALLHGETDWLAETYIYPMSIFVGDEIRIENSVEDTKKYIEQRRKDMSEAGVTSAKSKVLEITTKSDGRRLVLMKMSFLNAAGEPFAHNLTRFLCQLARNRSVRIESVEFVHLGVDFTATTRNRLLH